MTSSTTWKPLKNYEKSYLINEKGQVLSLPKKFIDRWGNERKTKARILKPTYRPLYGKYVYGLTDDKGKLSQHYQHILVAENFDRETPFYELKGEVWKRLDKTDYYVSNYGRVKVNRKCFDQKKMTFCSQQLIKPCKNGHGYLFIREPRKYIHRVVAELFIPNPHNLEQVDHINRDTTDNRVSNLQWVSAKENMRLAAARRRNSLCHI